MPTRAARGRFVRRLAVGALVAGSVVATAPVLSASPVGGATSSPIVVAVEGPMTGSQASTGQDMLRGGQLAASRINAAGGIQGRRLQVIAVDDEAEPSVGVQAARKAVARGAVGVVGPFNSAVGVKNLPVYRKAGLSIVRLTSATPTEGYGVTTQPMENQVAPVEVAELTGQLHARSVDVLFDPSTYTSGIANQLANELKARDVEVPLLRSVPEDATAGQRRSAVATVARHPSSVVYVAMYPSDAGHLARDLAAQAKAKGSSQGRCFVDLAAQDPAFVKAAGTAAASACLNSGVPAASQLPLGAAYTAAYLGAFKVQPGTWGSFTYDSMAILAAAMISSHQVRGAAVRDALAHTSGFAGVTGTTTVAPSSGNRQNPPVVILDITSSGRYVVDPAWATATGYPMSAGSATAALPAP